LEGDGVRLRHVPCVDIDSNIGIFVSAIRVELGHSIDDKLDHGIGCSSDISCEKENLLQVDKQLDHINCQSCIATRSRHRRSMQDVVTYSIKAFVPNVKAAAGWRQAARIELLEGDAFMRPM
jgi:hypothetical protein